MKTNPCSKIPSVLLSVQIKKIRDETKNVHVLSVCCENLSINYTVRESPLIFGNSFVRLSYLPRYDFEITFESENMDYISLKNTIALKNEMR